MGDDRLRDHRSYHRDFISAFAPPIRRQRGIHRSGAATHVGHGILVSIQFRDESLRGYSKRHPEIDDADAFHDGILHWAAHPFDLHRVPIRAIPYAAMALCIIPDHLGARVLVESRLHLHFPAQDDAEIGSENGRITFSPYGKKNLYNMARCSISSAG